MSVYETNLVRKIDPITVGPILIPVTMCFILTPRPVTSEVVTFYLASFSLFRRAEINEANLKANMEYGQYGGLSEHKMWFLARYYVIQKF